MSRSEAYRMIRRRAIDAGVTAPVSCHSFRATGITVYLENNGTHLASAILRYKGVVLDSLIEDRLVAEVSKASEDRDLVGKLAVDKKQLGQLLLQTPTRPPVRLTKRSRTLSEKWNKSRARWPRRFPVSAALDGP